MKNNEFIKTSPLILASSSPRRKDLLSEMRVPFEIIPSNTPELIKETLSPEENARELAKQKAQAIATSHPDRIVLGADTIVVLDGNILGKPASKDLAIEMLSQLSGRTHQVITGYALLKGSAILAEGAALSWVTMKPLDEQTIRDYVDSGEPMDKAGSYGAQGLGRNLISKIEGSLNNVIGLPTEDLTPWFKKLSLM